MTHPLAKLSFNQLYVLAYALLVGLAMLVLYGWVVPWLALGPASANYINRCVQAGMCPSLQQIEQRLAAPTAPAPPTPAEKKTDDK